MKIKIYQITRDKRHLMYARYERAVKEGGVDPGEYELVWEGDVEANDLEDVYVIFNRYDLMPDGYSGRSLSVSDVIVTEKGAFFCDAYGFVQIEGFEEG